MYVSIYIYICMCVCEREIWREKSKNIMYYIISFIVHICFVTISNIIFTRNFLVLQNIVLFGSSYFLNSL